MMMCRFFCLWCLLMPQHVYGDVVEDPLMVGWRMIDRFAGFRYETRSRSQKLIVEKADELGCFGWVQDSVRGTFVGEARCAKPRGPVFKEWLGENATIKDYADTKIRLHFSHFKRLPDSRVTCFPDEPHQCPLGRHNNKATERPQEKTDEL